MAIFDPGNKHHQPLPDQEVAVDLPAGSKVHATAVDGSKWTLHGPSVTKAALKNGVITLYVNEPFSLTGQQVYKVVEYTVEVPEYPKPPPPKVPLEAKKVSMSKKVAKCPSKGCSLHVHEDEKHHYPIHTKGKLEIQQQVVNYAAFHKIPRWDAWKLLVTEGVGKWTNPWTQGGIKPTKIGKQPEWRDVAPWTTCDCDPCLDNRAKWAAKYAPDPQWKELGTVSPGGVISATTVTGGDLTIGGSNPLNKVNVVSNPALTPSQLYFDAKYADTETVASDFKKYWAGQLYGAGINTPPPSVEPMLSEPWANTKRIFDLILSPTIKEPKRSLALQTFFGQANIAQGEGLSQEEWAWLWWHAHKSPYPYKQNQQAFKYAMHWLVDNLNFKPNGNAGVKKLSEIFSRTSLSIQTGELKHAMGLSMFPENPWHKFPKDDWDPQAWVLTWVPPDVAAQIVSKGHPATSAKMTATLNAQLNKSQHIASYAASDAKATLKFYKDVNSEVTPPPPLKTGKPEKLKAGDQIIVKATEDGEIVIPEGMKATILRK